MSTLTTVRERPILFKDEMVRAILSGDKSQTRRIIKSRHESGMFQVCSRVSDGQITAIESLDWNEENCEKDILCPYGEVGDILWVRETWQVASNSWCTFQGGTIQIRYKADSAIKNIQGLEKEVADKYLTVTTKPGWRPSIFMPREACRIRLEITEVRVERLQSITEDDAFLEGVTPRETYSYIPGEAVQQPESVISAREVYELLWSKIHGKDSWAKNEFVWVISFKRL